MIYCSFGLPSAGVWIHCAFVMALNGLLDYCYINLDYRCRCTDIGCLHLH